MKMGVLLLCYFMIEESNTKSYWSRKIGNFIIDMFPVEGLVYPFEECSTKTSRKEVGFNNFFPDFRKSTLKNTTSSYSRKSNMYKELIRKKKTTDTDGESINWFYQDRSNAKRYMEDLLNNQEPEISTNFVNVRAKSGTKNDDNEYDSYSNNYLYYDYPDVEDIKENKNFDNLSEFKVTVNSNHEENIDEIKSYRNDQEGFFELHENPTELHNLKGENLERLGLGCDYTTEEIKRKNQIYDTMDYDNDDEKPLQAYNLHTSNHPDAFTCEIETNVALDNEAQGTVNNTEFGKMKHQYKNRNNYSTVKSQHFFGLDGIMDKLRFLVTSNLTIDEGHTNQPGNNLLLCTSRTPKTKDDYISPLNMRKIVGKFPFFRKNQNDKLKTTKHPKTSTSISTELMDDDYIESSMDKTTGFTMRSTIDKIDCNASNEIINIMNADSKSIAELKRYLQRTTIKVSTSRNQGHENMKINNTKFNKFSKLFDSFTLHSPKNNVSNALSSYLPVLKCLNNFYDESKGDSIIPTDIVSENYATKTPKNVDAFGNLKEIIKPSIESMSCFDYVDKPVDCYENNTINEICQELNSTSYSTLPEIDIQNSNSFRNNGKNPNNTKTSIQSLSNTPFFGYAPITPYFYIVPYIPGTYTITNWIPPYGNLMPDEYEANKSRYSMPDQKQFKKKLKLFKPFKLSRGQHKLGSNSRMTQYENTRPHQTDLVETQIFPQTLSPFEALTENHFPSINYNVPIHFPTYSYPKDNPFITNPPYKSGEALPLGRFVIDSDYLPDGFYRNDELKKLGLFRLIPKFRQENNKNLRARPIYKRLPNYLVRENRNLYRKGVLNPYTTNPISHWNREKIYDKNYEKMNQLINNIRMNKRLARSKNCSRSSQEGIIKLRHHELDDSWQRLSTNQENLMRYWLVNELKTYLKKRRTTPFKLDANGIKLVRNFRRILRNKYKPEFPG